MLHFAQTSDCPTPHTSTAGQGMPLRRSGALVGRQKLPATAPETHANVAGQSQQSAQQGGSVRDAPTVVTGVKRPG